MFQTPLSKTLIEYGEVHDVFDGKFKKPYSDISNGKHQIRICFAKSWIWRKIHSYD